MLINYMMFNNQFDLLQIRMHELNDVIDAYIIVEANKTFQNFDKPLRLTEALKNDQLSWLTPQIRAKIHIVSITDMPNEPSSTWALNQNRHYRQMNGGTSKLMQLGEQSDLVVFTAADQLPKMQVLKSIKQNGLPGRITNLNADLMFHRLNYLDKKKWPGICIVTLKTVKQMVGWHEIRESKSLYHTVQNAGWHFTYVGSAKQIVEKVMFCSSHAESRNKISEDVAQAAIDQGFFVFDKSRKLTKTPITTEYLPTYVVQNQNKFKDIIA